MKREKIRPYRIPVRIALAGKTMARATPKKRVIWTEEKWAMKQKAVKGILSRTFWHEPHSLVMIFV
jgi:hypothetical protein